MSMKEHVDTGILVAQPRELTHYLTPLSATTMTPPTAVIAHVQPRISGYMETDVNKMKTREI